MVVLLHPVDEATTNNGIDFDQPNDQARICQVEESV